MNPGRYSVVHQARFLKACVDAPCPIQLQLERQGISPKAFARWLEQPTFRRRLLGVRRYLRHTRELQLELAALHAATTILDAVAKKSPRATKPRVDPTPFIEVIELARAAQTKPTRARKGEPRPTLDKTPLYHAELAEAQAEALIRELSNKTESVTTAE